MLSFKMKTTDIGHFWRLPDCHTAWSRILSVVFILYIIYHGCQYQAATEHWKIEERYHNLWWGQTKIQGYLADLIMGGYE
jgi:hypothetical protein